MIIRTWMLEMAFVTSCLASVVALSGAPAIEWVGAAAVVVAFAHAQVSERLAEREAQRATPDVDCHHWLRRYFVAKEVLWCAYFVSKGAWSALAGVGLFLAYPAWRAWWRTRYPVDA